MATEDPAAHRAGVAAAMGFRVNDVTVFVLAGRLGRCAAEALRMRGARGTGKHFQRFSIHHLSSITYWD
ncbi:putative olfactory receptor [Pseudomonas aeruginosa]|nr:putative olfactory receptor [Pseudomonas aeruginosa]